MYVERVMQRAGQWAEHAERRPSASRSVAVGLFLLLLLVFGVWSTTGAAASSDRPMPGVSDAAASTAPSEPKRHRAHATRSKRRHTFAAAAQSRKRRHATRSPGSQDGTAGPDAARDLATRAADDPLSYLYRVYGAEPRDHVR
jgi:type VI protein secretion system component VasK